MCLRGNFRTNRIQTLLTFGSRNRKFEVTFLNVRLFWHQHQSPKILRVFFFSVPSPVTQWSCCQFWGPWLTGPGPIPFSASQGKTQPWVYMRCIAALPVCLHSFGTCSQPAASSFITSKSALTKCIIHVWQPFKPRTAPVRWYKMGTSTYRSCRVVGTGLMLWCILWFWHGWHFCFYHCWTCQTFGGGLNRFSDLKKKMPDIHFKVMRFYSYMTYLVICQWDGWSSHFWTSIGMW